MRHAGRTHETARLHAVAGAGLADVAAAVADGDSGGFGVGTSTGNHCWILIGSLLPGIEKLTFTCTCTCMAHPMLSRFRFGRGRRVSGRGCRNFTTPCDTRGNLGSVSNRTSDCDGTGYNYFAPWGTLCPCDG